MQGYTADMSFSTHEGGRKKLLKVDPSIQRALCGVSYIASLIGLKGQTMDPSEALWLCLCHITEQLTSARHADMSPEKMCCKQEPFKSSANSTFVFAVRYLF